MDCWNRNLHLLHEFFMIGPYLPKTQIQMVDYPLQQCWEIWMMHGCKEECVNCVRLSCYRFVDGFLPNLHDYHTLTYYAKCNRTLFSLQFQWLAYFFKSWINKNFREIINIHILRKQQFRIKNQYFARYLFIFKRKGRHGIWKFWKHILTIIILLLFK